MNLAINKYGQIGRKVRENDALDSIIEPAMRGDNHSTVEVSFRSIKADEERVRAIEMKNRALAIQKELKARAKRIAEEQRKKAGLKAAQRKQAEKPAWTEDEMKIAKYTRMQMGMTETEKMARSMKANFNRYEILPAGPNSGDLKPKNGRADFRQLDLVGNPLTRNGSFGPVSDYDRFTKGTELDNAQVVGGTMLRKYDVRRLKPAPTTQQSANMGSMGWDLSSLWDSASNFVSTAVSSGVDKLEEQAPQVLADAALSAIKKELMPGDTVKQVGNTMYVTRAQQQPNIVETRGIPGLANSMGIPPVALYSVIGLLGLGVAFVGYRAFSKR